MAIIDAFSFYNELELLEIRLHELYDVVDEFVLVEATRTHTGKDKPLYYNLNKHKFANFSDKIVHVVVEDMPITDEEIQEAITEKDRTWLESKWQFESNWVRERFQRNAIMRVLQDAHPEDIIIIEDADEMVRSDVIASLDTILVDGCNAVSQALHAYYINWECTNMKWHGSKILRRKFVDNPSEHRCHTDIAKYIHNGGWHFSYLGGADVIKEKILSFAHQEFNMPEVFDNISNNLSNMKDGIGRLYQYKIVPIDNSYPKYLAFNLDKFEHWIYKEGYE